MESNSDIKVWYITGATSGVGLALVNKILENPNNRVTGTTRNLKNFESLPCNKNPNFLAIQVDILDEENIKESVKKTVEHFGASTIDFCFNCAGYGLIASVEEASMDEYKGIFECMYFYPIRVCKAVLPYMRAKKDGYIFNVSSVTGINAHARFGVYCGAKFALVGTTQSLAEDVKRFNIKVSCIILGFFKTKFNDDLVAGHGFAKNPMPEYDTKTIFDKAVAPIIEKLTPGDVDKLANLLVDHYCKQPTLDYNLFIGPEETWMGPTKKIGELKQQLDSQKELNTKVHI